VAWQSKMDRNNRYIPLYCNQSTQTQRESDYETEAESESSDFPPIRIGKRMSPTSAMCQNPHQLPEEEPPQLHCCQQHNTGLEQTNILNVVEATAPVQNEKMTL